MAGPPPKLHLPFAQWPQGDRRLWAQATIQDDPFDGAPGARLAKATLHKHCMAWRRFLGFLMIADPEALQDPAAERVTIVRVRNYARHLSETNTPYSVGCQIDAFYGAVRIMIPERDWSWLRQIKARLFTAAPTSSRRGPVITSLQLLELGLELMAESKVERGKPLTLEAAVQYRDGVIIAVHAYIPLRHKNSAAIEIGRDFVEEDGKWSVIIPPEESKTKVPIEFEVPHALQEPIDTYLKLVRPRMLRQPGCHAMWVSAKGGALSYSALGPVFTRHSTKRLGFRVTPHDARDAAVTLWAIAAPNQIGVARDLLAHEDLRMTTKYYNRAKGIEASRRHARLIAKIRKR